MERGRGGWWYRYRVRLALGGLILLGAAFRFYGLNWDQDHHLHPDERAIVFATQRLNLPPLEEWPRFFNPLLAGESPNFFRADSPLNPGFFAYGSLSLYLVRILAALLASLAPFALPGSDTAIALSQINDFDHLTMLGRVLSVFFDLGTIVVTYRLGKLLLHRGAGLLAAGFVAFTVLNIQYSHFFVVDIPLTFFVTLALYFAVLFLRKGGRGLGLLLGIATGLALATKFAAAPLVLVAVLAPILRYRQKREPPLAPMATVLISTFLAFAIAQPYALIDWPAYWGQIVEQANMVRGVLDYPYTRQYVGTTPYVYHLVQSTVWGMGIPLGIVAWAGLAYILWRNFRRPRPAEILLLAWAVPYFLISGSFYVKFLRYLLPLFPVLYVMGAQMLYAIHGRVLARLDARYLEKGTPHWGKPLGYATSVLLVSSGFIYSLAFAAIYSRPHTRIEASDWIRSNIPPGSTLTCEHWDDALPLEVNCSEQQDTLGMYSVMRMDLYEPDKAKYQEIREVLANADYIVLSSNRLYGSIPRSPLRYPITTRYYQLLFDGQLGFRRVATFTSYPALGRFTLIDDWADESFTVYDHPKALVFAKERNLSDDELAGLFEDALAQVPTAQNEEAWRADKTLLLEQPVGELPVVTDIGWNTLANANPMIAIITWLVAMQILGLVALPPTLLLFRRFADGGYILAKTLGWLLVGYLVWITASLHLAMHILPTYLLAILGVALFSGYVWYKRGGEIRALISSKRKIILLSEALFAAAFLGFVGIRLLNPDLWQPWTGGEKSMEFAFLNAITKSPYFPPYDPYFAHGYINYYYYGLYLVAGLVKLTGIMPSMAFNLAIPTLFAITVVNIFSLGYNLTRRVWVGIAAFGFVALLGNLDGAAQLWEGLRNLIQGSGSFPAFDYWRSSRVIPFTINEFPFWSFLFADLHPHMIGLPFTIFFLSVALSLAQGPGEENAPKEGLPLQSRVADWRGFLTFDQLGLGLVLTLSLGAVAVINLWDLPTYFLLLLGVFMLSVWSKGGTGNWRDALLTFAGVAILSLVLYWPFYANYAPLHAGLGLVNTRTDVGHFLTIWGFLIFVVASYLIIESSTRLAALASSRREVRLAILATVVVMAILFSLGEWLWGLLVPLVIIAGYLFWQRQGSVATSFAHLLIFMGLAILLGTEIFFLRDFLQGGEYQRMNTVFKFYMQAWVLLGIGGAAILPRLFAQIRSLRSTVVSTAWQGAFIVLLLGSSTFLFLGTKARVEDRFPGEKPAVGTLDGLAYMTVGRYFWPDQDHAIDLSYDYQAIQWLLANVQGTPVVAEAALPYYREGGLRVASYTGLPTLLGMHQNEQRYDWQVGQRDGEARAFFETADPNLALELIHRLHIQYIYVGQLERIVYPEYGLAKFESLRAQGWLELVYENPQVLLYRVVQAALADD